MVQEKISEEEELPDSRNGDLISFAGDVQLQGNCPALLRQIEAELPIAMHCTMELVRNKSQLTREDTDALHSHSCSKE